jgi:hypothetical protein
MPTTIDPLVKLFAAAQIARGRNSRAGETDFKGEIAHGGGQFGVR